MRALVPVVLTAALSAACASGRAVPRPGPAGAVGPPAGEVTPEASSPGVALGHRLVADALELRGTPYRNGGTDPRTGFDCSGLVSYVFSRRGLAVPRQTSAQFKAGEAVPRDRLQPGDLVFFSTVAPGASHVGIAIDEDEFVHAPSSRGVVRVERLTLPYWRTRFIGARRIR
ncbi:MAG: C40 family peptidase [Vicinamibacterales bacterium]